MEVSSEVYHGQVIESRVDYLTLTASGTSERIDLAEHAHALMLQQEADGNHVRPWAHWGYSGFGTQHAHWGERPDSDVLILGGALADHELEGVLPYASHVSRLDTCVTVRLPGVGDEVIREGYDSGRNHRFRGGHAPSFELLQHSTKGATLYIGSRSSRSFGRLYNKHRESELDFYAGCYRYEVEQKNHVAGHRAGLLAASPDRGSQIASDLYAFFSDRGVPPRFSPGVGRVPSVSFRPHSDDQRRLLWLAGQVRQSVQALTKRGLRDDVLAALGLDEEPQPLDKRPPLAYIDLAGHVGPT